MTGQDLFDKLAALTWAERKALVVVELKTMVGEFSKNAIEMTFGADGGDGLPIILIAG